MTLQEYLSKRIVVLAIFWRSTMPYVGGSLDRRLQDLKERQATRRSEVTAANKREDVKLSTFLGKLDSKHDREMINLNSKLHVTKIDLIREIHKNTDPKLLQHVQKRSKHLKEQMSFDHQPINAKFGAMRVPFRQDTIRRQRVKSPTSKLYPFHLIHEEYGDSTRPSGSLKKNANSPRQFPILAAKYYRESQLRSKKRPTESNKSLEAREAFKKLMIEDKKDHLKDFQSKSTDDTIPNNLLPPVSSVYASLSNSFPPPNSPRSRRNQGEFSLRNQTMTNEASNEELQGLRSGQYFLRYSSSLFDGNQHAEDFEDSKNRQHNGTESDESETMSGTMRETRSLQRKLDTNKVLSLVEGVNNPDESFQRQNEV